MVLSQHFRKKRAGVAIRYMPATSHFNRELKETGKDSGYLVNYSERPLWLLRENIKQEIIWK